MQPTILHSGFHLRFYVQVLGVMDRLDVEFSDAKAGQFKTDDLDRTLQSMLGDEASLAMHALPADQPLGMACLVSAHYSAPHCQARLIRGVHEKTV